MSVYKGPKRDTSGMASAVSLAMPSSETTIQRKKSILSSSDQSQGISTVSIASRLILPNVSCGANRRQTDIDDPTPTGNDVAISRDETLDGELNGGTGNHKSFGKEGVDDAFNTFQ